MPRSSARVDQRVDDHAAPSRGNGLREMFAQNPRVLLELCAGSLVSNMLGIATALFAMLAWDRVAPARSPHVLWMLAAGVGVALVLEYGLRIVRASISDHCARKADLALSELHYSRLLALSDDARSRCAGSLIARMRDFECAREALTSAALGALLDAPFAVVFILVIALLGGYLALPALVAAVLIVLPGFLVLRSSTRLSVDAVAASALRNAIWMESVHRAEDIQNLQAEPRFQALWGRANQRSSDIWLRQRQWVGMLSGLSGIVRNLACASVIIGGIYGIIGNELSTGVVIACLLLTGRALTLAAQLPAALARLQQAKTAKQALDALLERPDQDLLKGRHRRSVLIGRYRFQNVQYAHGSQQPLAMDVPALTIAQGERIAVLGRSGAGKSTLLRLLAGMAQPQQGRIVLDGMSMDLIDAADLRRCIGALTQDASLFHGSLLENLRLGAPLANEAAIRRAMNIACADRLLLSQPQGIDLSLREGGAGLSAGQKQVLLLARLILREPSIVLLDEPTAWLDKRTERNIIDNLDRWLGNRTLVVATQHRSILSLVKRVIVVEGGRIVLDAPKDQALAKLASQGSEAMPARPLDTGPADRPNGYH
ncbi:MAG: peptidase domain-containing ABC transporter [Nevskiaceae bacterium]|nr:peptidase domain-containing ABC transporter [Nevskiaceae bacterium]